MILQNIIVTSKKILLFRESNKTKENGNPRHFLTVGKYYSLGGGVADAIIFYCWFDTQR